MLALIVFLVLVSTPIYFYLTISKYKGKLTQPNIHERYNYMYQDLKHRYPLSLFHVVYMIRRLAFGLFAVLLQQYPYIQIALNLMTSLVYTQFLFYYRPFNTRKLNLKECFNEVCILCISIIYPVFLLSSAQVPVSGVY